MRALVFAHSGFHLLSELVWRGGRVVEGARLERVYTGNRIEGSNPSLSANLNRRLLFLLNKIIYWFYR